jgi:hypothetical protein
MLNNKYFTCFICKKKKKRLSNDEIGKENRAKKQRCRPMLTFQICDLIH